MSLSCGAKRPNPDTANKPTATPTATPGLAWSSNPTDSTDNEALKVAWKKFESSQKYRLAKPSDRNLTSAALARINSNGPHQGIPSISWWGVRGYRGFPNKDFLVAIVVDPSRTDPNRYGLVVLAAIVSEGPDYKPYWVSREEDMESYLISPASGSLFMECFRRDGTEQTKELSWDRNSRQFRLR